MRSAVMLTFVSMVALLLTGSEAGFPSSHPQYEVVAYGLRADVAPLPSEHEELETAAHGEEHADETSFLSYTNEELGRPTRRLTPAEADELRAKNDKKFYAPLQKGMSIEQFGCCRVCQPPEHFDEFIPKPAEYGLSRVEKHRRVSPEWGWETYKRAMVSCCPICGHPIKPEKYEPIPNLPNKMNREIVSFKRGDGPTDEEAGVSGGGGGDSFLETDVEGPFANLAGMVTDKIKEAGSEIVDKITEAGSELAAQVIDPATFKLSSRLDPRSPGYADLLRRPVPPPPEKPFNPLREVKGDPMAFNLVSNPDFTWDSLFPNNKIRTDALKKKNPKKPPLKFSHPSHLVQLPPCCEICYVNDPYTFTNSKGKDNHEACCYYCANRKYEFKPARVRPAGSRPPKKPRWSLQHWHKMQQRPQGREEDIFSVPIPIVHANRHRFD